MCLNYYDLVTITYVFEFCDHLVRILFLGFLKYLNLWQVLRDFEIDEILIFWLIMKD